MDTHHWPLLNRERHGTLYPSIRDAYADAMTDHTRRRIGTPDVSALAGYSPPDPLGSHPGPGAPSKLPGRTFAP